MENLDQPQVQGGFLVLPWPKPGAAAWSEPLLRWGTTLGVTVICVCVLRRWISGGRCRCSVRLDGKTALVTGANTGIGKETCLDLAQRGTTDTTERYYRHYRHNRHYREALQTLQRGARVIMACRDLVRGETAAEQIRSSSGNGNVVVRHLDLASVFSVRLFCSEILQTEDRLDLLINNAGVMMCPKWMTEDGFEMQLAVNHLGHFLLTNQLLPKLKCSAPSRIINVSSMAHRGGIVDVDDLFFSHRPYTPLKSYRQSKLANILFTRELAHRLTGSGVSSFCLHPGVIRTELGRHVQTSFPLLGALLSLPSLLLMKTPYEGCQTTVYCAVTPGLETKSGRYFSDCAEMEPASEAQDDDLALRLWNESCRLVGLN